MSQKMISDVSQFGWDLDHLPTSMISAGLLSTGAAIDIGIDDE